jgi:hypothetical protein
LIPVGLIALSLWGHCFRYNFAIPIRTGEIPA